MDDVGDFQHFLNKFREIADQYGLDNDQRVALIPMAFEQMGHAIKAMEEMGVEPDQWTERSIEDAFNKAGVVPLKTLAQRVLPKPKISLVFVGETSTALLKSLQEAIETRFITLRADYASDLVQYDAEEPGPDLILVDLSLPAVGGYAVSSELRTNPRFASVPIVLLTGSRFDIKAGLEAGADDFLFRPFEPSKLQARIKYLLQLGAPVPDSVIELDDLRLDLSTFRAGFRGRSVQLAPSEGGVLRYFMSNPGQVISPPHLLETVWGYSPPDTERHIDIAHERVKSLQKKLEEIESNRWHIRVFRGKYKFIKK